MDIKHYDNNIFEDFYNKYRTVSQIPDTLELSKIIGANPYEGASKKTSVSA